jgi:hypothetical protein
MLVRRHLRLVFVGLLSAINKNDSRMNAVCNLKVPIIIHFTAFPLSICINQSGNGQDHILLTANGPLRCTVTSYSNQPMRTRAVH